MVDSVAILSTINLLSGKEIFIQKNKNVFGLIKNLFGKIDRVV